MASTYNDNVQLNAPKALDNKRGRFAGGAWRPYNDLAEARTSVVQAYRHKCLEVDVLKDGIPTTYWWRDGLTDNDLVEKYVVQTGGGSITIDTNPIDGSANAVSSNGVFDALAGKANTSHGHPISDITNLQTELNGKAPAFTQITATGTSQHPLITLSTQAAFNQYVLQKLPAPIVYDTVQTFSSSTTDTDYSVTTTIVASANANSKFKFNSKTNIVGEPRVMTLRLSSAEVASVTFTTDYLNTAFAYTHSNGQEYTGFFTDNDVNL